MRVFGLGLPELIIILVIVVLLFGPSRFGKIFGELGAGLRSFRENLSEKNEEEDNTDEKGNIEPK